MKADHGKTGLSLWQYRKQPARLGIIKATTNNRRELVAIYRQEIMQDIRFFTSQPKARFYDDLFMHLDTSVIEESRAETGNPGYPRAALLCAGIVMKCEGYEQVSDLQDYLEQIKKTWSMCFRRRENLGFLKISHNDASYRKNVLEASHSTICYVLVSCYRKQPAHRAFLWL
jgi:hypothetical protein